LLHDLDYEATASDWTKHGVLAEEWLADYDLPPEIFAIIRAHNADGLGIECETIAEKAIYAVDPITGLITAAALMNPERKIGNLEAKSVLKKFKNFKFAAGANREHIKSCEDFGLPLEEFIAISLKAMQGIDTELGL
jgi:predicted hydrolase (HD superfamily)